MANEATSGAERPLTPYIDKVELSAAITAFLTSEPNVLAELDEFFFREGAPYKATGIPNYLFVLAERPASETPYTVGFRRRDALERFAALMTLEVGIGDRVDGRHCGISPECIDAVMLVSPAMVEAGYAVLAASAITDDLLEADRKWVVEIYRAMQRERLHPTVKER